MVKIWWSWLAPLLTDPPVWQTDGRTNGQTELQWLRRAKAVAAFTRKNTKTEVTSRNNVEHQSVPTPRVLQWMPMPMVERHVQACLNFSLSFCPRVRAVTWRHSDNNSVKRWNAAARLHTVWQWGRYLVPQNVFLVSTRESSYCFQRVLAIAS